MVGGEIPQDKNHVVEEFNLVNQWFESESQKLLSNTSSYIEFIDVISCFPIDTIGSIVTDLRKIYKDKNVYATDEDFISAVMRETVRELEYFLSSNPLPLGSVGKYNVYSIHLVKEQAYQIFLSEKSFEYCQQYFKKVLSLIYGQSYSEIDKNLSLREIALLYIYCDEDITKRSCDSIAKKFGWSSGHSLYQKYNEYSLRQNRIGDFGSEEKLKHQIQRFEKIEPLIPEHHKKRFLDEFNTLKSRY